MRWVVCAAMVVGLAPTAFAGDFDVLRGAEPSYHWGGVYGGVQGGYSSSVINFGNAASSELAYLLRDTAIEQDQQISNWTVLGARSPTSASYGGFVGYNVEWENVIVGMEVNYNRVSLSAASGDSIGRSFTDSANLPTGHHYLYDVNVSAQSSAHITDIATLRARAGWETSIFLPYAFFGLAVGRASVSTSATLQYSATDFPDPSLPPLTPLPDLDFPTVGQSNAQNNAFMYGFTTGLGTEVALTPNLFVRGEFEYIYFAPLDGIKVSVTSGRVGAGIRF